MTYNTSILGTESLKNGVIVTVILLKATVRVMILMIPRKVISYDPISFGLLS